MKKGPSVASGPGQRGLVSVVIPTYNRAHLIAETIESVLAQTYEHIEILVVDDGSQDNTRDVVAERSGTRVRYIHQENAGVSAARNTGFRHARGEYIALLDSDDVWLSWKLDVQVQLLERLPDLGMVWTDMRAINEAGEPLHERYLRIMYSGHSRVNIEDICTHAGTAGQLVQGAPEDVREARVYYGNIFSEMILGNLVHTSTVLLRRSRLEEAGGFDESLRPAGEDYEFHLRTCAYGPVGLLDAPSILYRVGQDDAITAPRNNVHFARAYLQTIEDWLSQEPHRIELPAGAISNCLADAHTWVGRAELDIGNTRTARHHLLRSVRHRPAQPALLVYMAMALLPGPVNEAVRTARRWLRGIRRARSA